MNMAQGYSRPLGIAELVRQHGDRWSIEGHNYARRIHDERLLYAMMSLSRQNSSDFSDYVKMFFYTKRIYNTPINEVRGRE